MADGTPNRDVPQGFIKRENADALVMACLVCLAASRHDDTERETALHLLERGLPLASRAPRIETLRPLALAVLAAAPGRKTREGATAWLRAMLDLDLAMSRDALTRALALVEV
jgi:hypothetical protein